MEKPRRTTHRNSAGKKLYAVRDSKGRFKDIQTYERASQRPQAQKQERELGLSAFGKLNLQVRLLPVERAGERPYWRAVATCELDALMGETNLYPHPSGRRKPAPTHPVAGGAGS